MGKSIGGDRRWESRGTGRGFGSYGAEVGEAPAGRSPSLCTTPDEGTLTYARGHQLLKTEPLSGCVVLKYAFINQPVFAATCHVPGTVPGTQMGQRVLALGWGAEAGIAFTGGPRVGRDCGPWR